MKLVKDGKQSILTYNDSKSYKDLGNVIDTINNRIRVPVNHRIREAFESLKPHLLIIAGYWNKDVASRFNFNSGVFEPNGKKEIPVDAITQMQNTTVDYCYNNKGIIAIKGKMRILDSMSTIEIHIKDIKEVYEYEFYSFLENDVEELFSAIEEWDEQRTSMNKSQMAMSFVEINQNLTAKEAVQLLANMDEDERNELVMKEMLKFTVVVDEMEGNEEEEMRQLTSMKKDKFKEIPVDLEEDEFGEVDVVEKQSKRKEVIKQKKKPAAKAPKPSAKDLDPIEEDEDEFADIEGNIVPMI